MATIKFDICEFSDGSLVVPMEELEYSNDLLPRFHCSDGYSNGYETMEEACEAIDEYGEPGVGYIVLTIVSREEKQS